MIRVLCLCPRNGTAVLNRLRRNGAGDRDRGRGRDMYIDRDGGRDMGIGVGVGTGIRGRVGLQYS